MIQKNQSKDYLDQIDIHTHSILKVRMSTSIDKALFVLDNQPNGKMIASGHCTDKDNRNIPFNKLSRSLQINQIASMVECGISMRDLQEELYLVSNLPTGQVWSEYGSFMID